MSKFIITFVASAAFSGSAVAGSTMNLTVNVDGNQTTTQQMGQLTAFGDYSYTGAVTDAYPVTAWAVGWNLVSDSNANSFVTNGFTIANLSSMTKRFNITLEIAGMIPTAGARVFTGSLGGTLTSSSSASSNIASVGSLPLWKGLLNGSSPGTNSELLSSYALTVPGSTTGVLPSTIITPYSAPASANSSLGYQFEFDLSSNAMVSFSGVWSAVPSPSALTLIGCAGVTISRRRRSN